MIFGSMTKCSAQRRSRTWRVRNCDLQDPGLREKTGKKAGVLPADSFCSVRIEIAAVAALLRNDMCGLLENV